MTIGVREGKYKDMLKKRRFKVKVYGSAIPESVTVNGKNTDFEYLGDELALSVILTETSCSKVKTVKIHYPASTP